MRSDEDRVAIEFSADELALVCEALDSHEYWQLGDQLPRNNGLVFLPGDALGQVDRYWAGREPSADEQLAIESIARCRMLAERLGALVNQV